MQDQERVASTPELGQNGVGAQKRSTYSMSECFVGYDECDPQAILYDARFVKRATAISHHANEYSIDFKDVECRTIYARWLTRQEQWDQFGREHEQDNADERYACPHCGAAAGDACEDVTPPDLWHEERHEAIPEAVPADWRPDDSVPAWEQCERTDDGAIRVFRCEVPDA